MMGIMRWNLFFGTVSVLIITTLIVPHFFGLQNFTQWGGMYTDGWCSIFIASEETRNFADPPSHVKTKHIQGPSTSIVWYAPMQSEETCIAWAQSHCNTVQEEGWSARAISAYFRQRYLFEGKNVCAMTKMYEGWFIQPIRS